MPGTKYKFCGKLFFWLMTILSVLTGLLTCFADHNFDWGTLILYIVIVPICSYLCSLTLIGFGELVESSANTSKKIDKILYFLEEEKRQNN